MLSCPSLLHILQRLSITPRMESGFLGAVCEALHTSALSNPYSFTCYSFQSAAFLLCPWAFTHAVPTTQNAFPFWRNHIWSHLKYHIFLEPSLTTTPRLDGEPVFLTSLTPCT